MKTRIQIALMGCLASIGAHLYLTLHYYPLKFGFAGGQSLCNVNDKFNCDAVSASAYSAIFGVPLSLWGAMTNLVLFGLILISWLEWTENPERFKRWTLVLAGLSLGASVVMGSISFGLMHSYCLFCILLYALSAVVFFSFRGMVRAPILSQLQRDLPNMWGESKGLTISLLSIPVLAFLGHQMFMQNFGSSQIDHLVTEAVQEWQSAPKLNFVAKPSMVMGPAADRAAMTIVEFADFRCSHCKHASYTLDAFVKSHPDVRFEFYAFPLDGACNEKIERSDGMSCRLAAAVYCAEQEGKGWDLHHVVYDRQDEILHLNGIAELDPMLAQIVSSLGLNWERVQTCIKDPNSQDAIRAQAKQGALVNVMGTPTLFANGKLLSRGQMIPVLQAVRSKALESAQNN